MRRRIHLCQNTLLNVQTSVCHREREANNEASDHNSSALRCLSFHYSMQQQHCIHHRINSPSRKHTHTRHHVLLSLTHTNTFCFSLSLRSYTDIHTHTPIHDNTHTHTYTHIHIHTHVNTPSYKYSRQICRENKFVMNVC